MAELSMALIERLKKLASSGCWSDDADDDGVLMVDDYAGGNIDDAFYGGQRDGAVTLAREILTALDIDWS